MEKLRFTCRVEKEIKDHSIIMGEFLLGDGIALIQCLSCGIMGIERLDKAK